MLVLFLGVLGTVCTAVASVPQLVKACQTQKTNDLSLFSILVRICSSCVWGAWSFLKQEWIMMASCLVMFATECTMLCFCLLQPTH